MAETLSSNDGIVEVLSTLRRNLLRLWTLLAQTGQPQPAQDWPRLTRALETLMDRAALRGGAMPIAEPTEESKLLAGLFPAGLPALEHVQELSSRPLPPDMLELASSLIVGASPAIRSAIDAALRLAPTSAPILISGETGTGKDLFARLIHSASAVAGGPYISVNCAALPETLLFAELFGYEPGSFTGAAPRGNVGRIEAAHGGTLLLDEIAELPPSGQAALLRFLDSGEVQKIGRIHPRRAEVRLLCATHQDLEQLVAAGRFRADLYYRIALIPLHIPPLRERPEDISLLAEYGMRMFRQRHRRASPSAFSLAALETLRAQSWPGNVRELLFAVERAFLVCRGAVLEPADFVLRKTAGGIESDSTLQFAERLRGTRPALFRDRLRWGRFLMEHQEQDVTTGDVVREFGISEASARIRLAALTELGLVLASGRKKGRKYRVLSPLEG